MTGTNSVLRPKNSTKKGKNSKNPLLLTKILKLLHGQFFTIWAQFFFLFLKKSSDGFKSTYKTKKEKKKFLMFVCLFGRVPQGRVPGIFSRPTPRLHS
jgi:hypothetical protein